VGDKQGLRIFTHNRVSSVPEAAMGVNTAVSVVANHGYICTTEAWESQGGALPQK